MKRKILFILFFTVMSFACRVNGQDVYVIGYENSGRLDESNLVPHNKSVAKIWKNGIVQNLTDGGEHAKANSIYVSDNDVYIVGYEQDVKSKRMVAKVWKNGVAQDLTDGTYNAQAVSIFVSDSNDVYVVGYENVIRQGNPVARLWKNGIVQNLTDESKESKAHSVFVFGNDVYVAGIEREAGYFVAKVWKNGIAQNLTDGRTHAKANSVFVYCNDVYVAGYEYASNKDVDQNRDVNQKQRTENAQSVAIAKVWKNGIVQNFTDGGSSEYANLVYVSDNDVYVIVSGKKLWKNGVVIQEFSNGDSANAVCVDNNDVYISGRNYTESGKIIAKFWKNGVGQNLTDGCMEAVATCIFVK